MSSDTKERPVEIDILHWEPVAVWYYNIANENQECSLCKNKVTTKCVECLKSVEKIDAYCPITKGKCGHGFHYHCMNNCTKQSGGGYTICPICNNPWNYESNNLDERAFINKNS